MNGPVIVGVGYYGEKTKDLVREIPDRSVALINHKDIDAVAAESLIKKEVKAIINYSESMTGTFYHEGVKMLLEHHIPVYDLLPPHDIGPLKEVPVMVNDDGFFTKDKNLWENRCEVRKWDATKVMMKITESQNRQMVTYKTFMENSLAFANDELTQFVKSVESLRVFSQMEGKNVIVVARGTGYVNDLIYWKEMMCDPNTVIIAVDGACEGVDQIGSKADYIVGDMDSVPKEMFYHPAIFIAHAYLDGNSPGNERLQEIGRTAITCRFPGVSEDLAVALACKSGANHVYTIGLRSGYLEMLEKNRPGMGSTILTKAFFGDRISDLKGTHHFQQSSSDLFSPRKRSVHRILGEERDWNVSEEGRR
ncbi:putative cytokinetic ring protein SteA [Alteribacter aurantiacus]|uniref:putative cytokinetic ring protein SteA n=1 Tax=Alteribacter aurantiacus TaxID=254410 RepID=UPI0003FC696E|nr:putative cytokinetic ring protein SteA [Alteribacter aurantiacus]